MVIVATASAVRRHAPSRPENRGQLAVGHEDHSDHQRSIRRPAPAPAQRKPAVRAERHFCALRGNVQAKSAVCFGPFGRRRRPAFRWTNGRLIVRRRRKFEPQPRQTPARRPTAVGRLGHPSGDVRPRRRDRPRAATTAHGSGAQQPGAATLDQSGEIGRARAIGRPPAGGPDAVVGDERREIAARPARSISANASRLLPAPGRRRGSARRPRRRRPRSRAAHAARPALMAQGRQVDDEARAGAVRTGPSAPPRPAARRGRAAGSSPRCARHAPRRSGARSTIPDRNSVRNPDRPVGVEALENPLEGVRRDARAVVVDRDDDPVVRRIAYPAACRARGEANAHLAARLGKGAGVVDEIGDDLGEPQIVAEHEKVRSRRASRAASTDSRSATVGCAANRGHRRRRRRAAPRDRPGSESPRASSASSREASEMSLISRSSRRTSCCMTAIRRSRDRPVCTRGRVSRGAAQRRQRVLQFVRDIGGEALDRVEPAVERLRHIAAARGKDGRSRRSGR